MWQISHYYYYKWPPGLSRGTGEGLRQLLWIWRVRRKVPHAYTEDQACIEGNTLTTENDVEKCESLLPSHLILNTASLSDLKIEYAKAKARVARWHEEILLIREEMRRSVAFLQWKARWWRALMAEHPGRIDIQRGLTAYSRRQEAQLLGLAEQFATLWHPTLQAGGFEVSWIDDFLSTRQQH